MVINELKDKQTKKKSQKWQQYASVNPRYDNKKIVIQFGKVKIPL